MQIAPVSPPPKVAETTFPSVQCRGDPGCCYITQWGLDDASLSPCEGSGSGLSFSYRATAMLALHSCARWESQSHWHPPTPPPMGALDMHRIAL